MEYSRKDEAKILQKDHDNVFEKMFLTPDMLRHMSIEEFKSDIEDEKFDGSYKDILGLLRLFEDKIETILVDEIDFHNYWIYTKNFIFYVYIETNCHDNGIDEIYEMRVIPRYHDLVTFKTYDEVKEAHSTKIDRQLQKFYKKRLEEKNEKQKTK